MMKTKQRVERWLPDDLLRRLERYAIKNNFASASAALDYLIESAEMPDKLKEKGGRYRYFSLKRESVEKVKKTAEKLDMTESKALAWLLTRSLYGLAEPGGYINKLESAMVTAFESIEDWEDMSDTFFLSEPDAKELFDFFRQIVLPNYLKKNE